MTVFEDALSTERFSRFLNWTGGDRDAAIELYTSNVLLSETLHVPLHILEVTLRNRIHMILAQEISPCWFDDERVQRNRKQMNMLAKAKQELGSPEPPAPASLIPALTFGYWTAFFGPEYEDLWRASLHRIARTAGGRRLGRKQFSSRLGPIRKIRNRIAHYEPIIHSNLPQAYADMLQLIEWLSPSAALWCRDNSRFDAVWAMRSPEIAALP